MEISLANVEPRDPPVIRATITEQATFVSVIVDVISRLGMVIVLAVLFVWLNMTVLNFVMEIYQHDTAQLAAAAKSCSAADRLVTTNVLMALIGATVVQTGAGLIAVVSYLFPKRLSDK